MLNRSKVISIRTRSAVFRGNKKTETLVRYHITHTISCLSLRRLANVRPTNRPYTFGCEITVLSRCGMWYPSLMPLKRLCFFCPPLFLSVFSLLSSGWHASPLVEQNSF